MKQLEIEVEKRKDAFNNSVSSILEITTITKDVLFKGSNIDFE